MAGAAEPIIFFALRYCSFILIPAFLGKKKNLLKDSITAKKYLFGILVFSCTPVGEFLPASKEKRGKKEKNRGELGGMKKTSK